MLTEINDNDPCMSRRHKKTMIGANEYLDYECRRAFDGYESLDASIALS